MYARWLKSPVPEAAKTAEPAGTVLPEQKAAARTPVWTRAWDKWTPPLVDLAPHSLQAKLIVSQPGDPEEEAADRAAEQVTEATQAPCGGGGADGRCGASDADQLGLQRKSEGASSAEVPASVTQALHSSGMPLDPGTRLFMEQRFGQDFSHVRVHADTRAAESAADLNAHAFTVGRDIVFGAAQYAPASREGNRLIAHELAHTVQQGGTASRVQRDHYTQQEREAMTQGRVTGRQADIDLANQRHFQPGDIVFRSGSTALGLLTGEDVTHGGIYIGNGLIHDAVGLGNRNVRVSDFFNPALGEAVDPNVYHTVRFRGPLRDLIVNRLVDNIRRRDFDMPTDPVPFNLFSSADDYRTATCLEYAHAQFLYAIRQLAGDPNVSPADRALLRTTYFAPGATTPNALIRPREQRLIGDVASPGGGLGSPSPGFGGGPPRSPSALVQEGVLITAASALASDVDPARFRNRSESQYTVHWPGGPGTWGDILNAVMGPTYDEVVLRTFTYRSFVDSRQFFEDVTGR